MKAFISENACPDLLKWLADQGCEIVFTRCDNVDEAISRHPDLIMCLTKEGVFYGDSQKLTCKYPGDVLYNAASTGKYFIHNLKYTDPDLLDTIKREGQILVNVKQGYAKCNIVVVDEDSIITSDRGIASACEGIMDVLLITEGHIALPGFNTGFIGGCSGRLSRKVFFNGDLRSHPDYKRILSFIHSRGLDCLWFEGSPMTDIGSIIIEP